MDGVFEIVPPGGKFTYEFEARPAAMHLYHCHSTPLKKHIAKGLYGALIIDPKEPRAPAQELVMVMNGYDTDGDGENNFYTVNGRTFYYARYPITVKRSQLVRMYLANLTEFDPINSFHLHADFFRYYPTGSGDQFEYTDIVMQCQGQRGIIEIEFAHTGTFMFHAHQSEFTELGWMGFFNVDRLMEAATPTRPRATPGGSGRSRPILLLAVVVGAFVTSGSSLARPRRSQPAAGRRLRHPPRRVQARRDPHPRHEPADRRDHDRLGHCRRRDRAVHGRRASSVEAPALEHRRRPVRLGPGRADLASASPARRGSRRSRTSPPPSRLRPPP